MLTNRYKTDAKFRKCVKKLISLSSVSFEKVEMYFTDLIDEYKNVDDESNDYRKI